MAYATGFNISKAGKYTITYYINNLDAIKTASNLSTGTNFGSAVLSTINIGANRTGSDVYYTDSTKSATISAQLPNHLKFAYAGAFVDYTFSKINSAIDFKDAELSNGETWYKVTHAFETKEAHQKVCFFFGATRRI